MFTVLFSKYRFGLIAVTTIILLLSCSELSKKSESVQTISDPVQQDSLFKCLVTLTGNSIHDSSLGDSLAFLVLPVEASCPSCRKKTIDSLIMHKESMSKDHFVIISASAGIKFMNSFFLEQSEELPKIENQLFLDSTNQAHKYDLFKDNPVMYYSANRKVYKKVAAIPATVRNDLKEFFSDTQYN